MGNRFGCISTAKHCVKRNIFYISISFLALICLAIAIYYGCVISERSKLIYDLSIGGFTSLGIIVITELLRNHFIKNKLINKYKIKYLLFLGTMGRCIYHNPRDAASKEELYADLFHYCKEINNYYEDLEPFEKSKNTKNFLANSHSAYNDYYRKYAYGYKSFNSTDFFNENKYNKYMSFIDNTENSKAVNSFKELIKNTYNEAKKEYEIDQQYYKELEENQGERT